MNPEKLSMLTPKTADLSGARGGVPNLTPEDIAAALHRLDPLEHELIRVKYCGDAPHGLYAHVLEELMTWDELERGEADRVAQQIIVEVVGHNRCPTCKGTKSAVVAGKVKNCPLCRGTGLYFHQTAQQEHVDQGVRWLTMVESNALAKAEGVDYE